MLQGILGQLNTQLPNTGATGAQGNAIDQINANNARFSSFAPSVTGITNELLAGGGANNQAGNIDANYQRFVGQTNPLASNTNFDPYSTPGFREAVDTMRNDITNQVNGSFAAAGRDFSGANFNALGRGISSGIAPTIANQYNQNIQNQQGAAGNLYNAGNTNAGILSGLQQQSLANKSAGVGSIGTGLEASNAAATSTLAAEAQRLGIPLQNLGLLANIGIPIAGLGGQSSGTATTTQQQSPLQQFGQLAGGLTGLFGGGGGTTVGNIFKMISDRRAKEDIRQVGTLFDGTPVYRFRYIGQPAFQIGLMAQDVEKTTPEAVGQIGQFKAVDYKIATDKAVEAA